MTISDTPPTTSGAAGRDPLERLLAKVADDDLRAELMETYARSRPKKFGLVYEDHEPDAVTLPAGTPIRMGDIVRRETAGKAGQQLYKVLTTGVRGFSMAPIHGAIGAGEYGTIEMVDDTSDLRVVKAWGLPVYPGLTRIGEPVGEGTPGAPEHMVIQGENLHVLQALKYTHQSKVDLIYLDPPYNTGNKSWIYNDSYVAEKDAFRHSKWLAFMQHRLTIARDLLKDTGVIFVAIGDDEHHRLRMLMDEIFGADNFISDIAWAGSKKNDSVLVSNVADYMVVYGRSVEDIRLSGHTWREPKSGIDEIASAGREAWEHSGGNAAEATRILSKWWSSLPKDHPSKIGGRSTTNFKYVDDEARPGEVYADSNLSFPNGEGPRYEVTHPNGKPVTIPKTGWSINRETMDRLIAAKMIHFGDDEKRLLYRTRFLSDSSNEVVASVFSHPKRTASEHLESLLGEKRFPFPKDHEVLMRWIRMAAPKDAVILDFFGGSGTTEPGCADVEGRGG